MYYKHECDKFNVETRSMERTLFIEVTKLCKRDMSTRVNAHFLGYMRDVSLLFEVGDILFCTFQIQTFELVYYVKV